MITRIDLEHFKCFQALRLPLNPLTLLSGTNASGKSSVMQALVLLHQTMRNHEWSDFLALNGTTVSLGTVRDVVDEEYGSTSCKIALHGEGTECFRWEFAGERDAMSMHVKQVSGEALSEGSWQWKRGDSKKLRYLVPESECDSKSIISLRGLTYLGAERLGPRSYYTHDDPQLVPDVGTRGEQAISVLSSLSDQEVALPLVIKQATPLLERQVEARMGTFFPNFALKVEPVIRNNALTLAVRTTESSSFFRPVNSGFGLTQVLPVVVAALSAKPNDLLLIENPESHLHPSGQAAMGKFLAEVAAANIQLIIETHSDHVLNGIRRAVKDQILDGSKVAIHFFRPRSGGAEDHTSQVETLEMDSSGNIDSWPSGFFDQFDRDMNYFAGWS